ncbi:hypothetical protein JZ751_017173 [Albula glossodonta]|uniref:Uncharacterized protein n=1 Tax=Albula glossodonta TaxID=121402 RepID=A0A8T2NMY7_9TELE|nr:hypothetical protein JZ751_017173 [Albula glossodonta]
MQESSIFAQTCSATTSVSPILALKWQRAASPSRFFNEEVSPGGQLIETPRWTASIKERES